MKDLRLLNRVLIILTTVFLIMILTPAAFAGQAEARWFTPYYEGNSVTMPDDAAIETSFDFTGTIKDQYKGILVKVSKGNDSVHYYYPAVDNAVQGDVYLRFGKGAYRVDFNLVKPNNGNPGVIKYDSLARVQVENTGDADMRYLLPSWGIESDASAIVQKAQQISGQADDDYKKVKNIFDWVSKNMVYDMDKFRRGEFYDNEGAVKALQTKKGLCRDYANLVTALVRAEGIEARTVIGQAGTDGNWYGHAWNEVKIGGRWISMDAVWKVFDQDNSIFGKTHIKAQEVY